MEVTAFVCPVCREPLASAAGGYRCGPCGRLYPVLCGIPDFRILPDRYISIEDDRQKGLRLFDEAAHRSFAEMLDYYYSITPEVPPALARKFTAHALVEVEIGNQVLAELDHAAPGGALLDVGCSTGGFLVAAAGRFPEVVGVDVAFRWLVVGTVRLRDAGAKARLVCANAEFLPFATDSFGLLTAIDLIEHVADPKPVLRECRRVAAPNGLVYVSTNNRYSLAPEPHVNVWGVGWLPRALQPAYVHLMAGRSYRNIALRSPRELDRFARAAGFRSCRTEAAPLAGARLGGGWFPRAQAIYDRARRMPGLSALLRMAGPRVQLLCRK
jgi:ubiquinone/menaquinone biosynthesis C-methylase UbiE/uncharacterized protein YbaR (Trm112 family)